MARASTTSDAFNAVAEPQRREIINLLAQGEQSVNDIADLLHMRQPAVSKHLRVLREVGLVSVREAGQQRLYRLNSAGLKPIYDWVSTFERLWNDRLDRLAAYLDEIQAGAKQDSAKQDSAKQESESPGKSTGKSIGKSTEEENQSEHSKSE